MNIDSILTQANIASALLSIAMLLVFVVHYLDKKDKNTQHK